MRCTVHTVILHLRVVKGLSSVSPNEPKYTYYNVKFHSVFGAMLPGSHTTALFSISYILSTPTRSLKPPVLAYCSCAQGRINHGAKRAMAQGPRRKGPPAPPRKKFRLFNCHLYKELFD